LVSGTAIFAIKGTALAAPSSLDTTNSKATDKVIGKFGLKYSFQLPIILSATNVFHEILYQKLFFTPKRI